jgi:hypothetical protein
MVAANVNAASASFFEVDIVTGSLGLLVMENGLFSRFSFTG